MIDEMPRKAILKGKIVQPIEDLNTWAKWFESSDRSVANDFINGVRISTIFLGLNHGFFGPPLWFETMVFGGRFDGFIDRYQTWSEAEVGHLRVIGMIGGVH